MARYTRRAPVRSARRPAKRATARRASTSRRGTGSGRELRIVIETHPASGVSRPGFTGIQRPSSGKAKY